MATESQSNVLEFPTEDARFEAINSLDDHDPANVSKIDDLMKAPIKAKSEAADQTSQKTADPAPTEPEAKVEEKTAPVDDKDEPIFTLKRSELPQGYDTPGKAFKSLNEGQALIERQQKFIKEKLAGGDQNIQAALKRAEQAEAALAEAKARYEKPAQAETKSEGLSPLPQSKLPKINEIRSKLKELSKDPIANEDQILDFRGQLDDLMTSEIERNQQLYDRAAQRAEAAEKKAMETASQVSGWVNKSQMTESQRVQQDALKKEFGDIDGFASDQKYSEFKLSKPSGEVEREYITWAQEVTSLYYGAPVNIETQDGMKAMRHALAMLERGAPDITEKCRVSGVPQQPSEDVKKYLEICQLLDYRDGYRIDPVSGKKEIIQRYHAPTGKYVPDTFPSLSAAYEDRKIRDGVYEKRIREAYSKGGAAMVEAIAKRDSGAAEMGNAQGASKKDAGIAMSKEDAAKIVNSIDETAALRQQRAGDPSLMNKLNEAFKVLGIAD